MKQISELLNTGVFESFTPTKKMTVQDLLNEMGIEDKMLGILVNGKKASLKTVIDEHSEVVIMPMISGG